MALKLLKIFLTLTAAGLALLVLLYLAGPYFMKHRMAGADIKTEPEKYGGLDALPENGRILFVIAHPDDLEFMAGGTVPKLIERNNDVYLVLLTDGGKQRYTPAFYSRKIVKVRRAEQIKLGELQGLKDIFFLTYPDGSLKATDEAIEQVDRIAANIDATHIFTFEPGRREGRYDSDHDAAGQVGIAVAKKRDEIEAAYYFRAAEPDIVIDITDTFERKLEILFMFTEFRYKKRPLRALHEAWAEADGRRIGVTYGEAFRRVDTSVEREEEGAISVIGEKDN